jgi:predicted amidohydrolase YtcJ
VNKTLALYARMSAAGLLSAHIAATVVADANGNAQAQIQQVKALQHQFNVIPNLSVLGFKIFADGVIEYPTQTAALSKPYTNNGSYGVLMVNPSKFNGFVVAADKQGLLVHVHAIATKPLRLHSMDLRKPEQ